MREGRAVSVGLAAALIGLLLGLDGPGGGVRTMRVPRHISLVLAPPGSRSPWKGGQVQGLRLLSLPGAEQILARRPSEDLLRSVIKLCKLGRLD